MVKLDSGVFNSCATLLLNSFNCSWFSRSCPSKRLNPSMKGRNSSGALWSSSTTSSERGPKL
ncbi:hypothetical protein BMETH_1239_2 [methanotrophic bacterial endosymbiont of Bathymodiolus sp.]|nr:hypothetical protein BMETH_1239_2 [methanotrophic bacterial endosymbiont of Bathymodiolus sp.]